MIIDVTQEDIDSAGHSCMSCPIARAVRRALKFDDGVHVYPQSTHILNNAFPNTPEMKDFIIAFDNNGFVEPESFVVNWGKYK